MFRKTEIKMVLKNPCFAPPLPDGLPHQVILMVEFIVRVLCRFLLKNAS